MRSNRELPNLAVMLTVGFEHTIFESVVQRGYPLRYGEFHFAFVLYLEVKFMHTSCI